ncbi:MAG: putative metal-binding motif-containing protein [Myxococcales bacterium]|nr:MAG: putative metal-binding motif-containing protein [Myxococcales bacterium]
MSLRIFNCLIFLGLVSGCGLIVDADSSRFANDFSGSASSDAGTSSPDASLCPIDCDDGVACTEDLCVDGSCQNTPNDALCGDAERCHPTRGCIAARCTDQASCDDGLVCNGEETCSPGHPSADPVTGCLGGLPMNCGSGDQCDASCYDCGSGSCSESLQMCVYAGIDDDGDGATVDSSNNGMCEGGSDCNDQDAAIHPGADEYCDDTDSDCNGDALNQGNCFGQSCSMALPVSGSSFSFINSFRILRRTTRLLVINQVKVLMPCLQSQSLNLVQ